MLRNHKMELHALLLSLLLAFCEALDILPSIQYSISRRGGSFPAPEVANLTFLLSELRTAELRLNASTRSYEGDSGTLVRKPRRLHGTESRTILLGEAGRSGNWFATLEIGNPIQTVDMDLDMLTADWWILSTRSGTGSFYLDFKSQTYQDSQAGISFPTCHQPTDIIHLPTIERTIPITFPHCKPAKQWIRSLIPSGAYLGLAPGGSLSQTNTKPLLTQLLEKKVVQAPLFSLMLDSGQHGILTVGGFPPNMPHQVHIEGPESKFPWIVHHQDIKRDETLALHKITDKESSDSTHDWKWLKLFHSDGWWRILMNELWVNGVKISKSQSVVLDINVPFLIAPEQAARDFYATIFGSRRLPPPYDQFHAYPCFSPPQIYFMFDDWKVKVLRGNRDAGTFSPGGRFSLGRTSMGSGYCVGIVVESRFGREKETKSGGSNWDENDEEGLGLENVLIIGEGFFNDVQVAFDWKQKMIGLQSL